MQNDSHANRPAGLTAGVIRYYRISILVVAGLLIYGALVLLTIPRNEDPEFDVVECRVVTRYPGANAGKVESLVTRPIEEAIRELDGIKVLASSSAPNFSLVKVTMRPDAVPPDVVDEIREQVEEVRRDLPDEAEEPRTYGYNTGDIPVCIIALSGPPEYRQLQAWAERIKARLGGIEGVSTAEIEGAAERQINIDVNNERLSRFKIPLTSIWEIIRFENAAVPGGTFDVGPRSYQLHSPNEFRRLEDVGGTVIGSTGPEGSLIYLRSTADVVDGYATHRYRVRTNGRPALLISVKKRHGTNTVSVAADIRDQIRLLRSQLPEGFELHIINDRGRSVGRLLGNLGLNALGGGLIVVLLVSLFLGVRQGLVVTVSIPLSVLITFILMRLSGIDLTQVSIFGLVLALGMLVDSSMVVVESIGSRLEQGEAPFVAVTNGVGVVRTPVISSVLTTVAAFVPMLLLTGTIGKFIFGLPMTVIFSLIGSLLVALTIIPLLSFTLWKSFPPASQEVDRGSRVLAFYTELAKAALRNRTVTLIMAAAAFALAVAAIPLLGLQLFPKAEKAMFLINIRLPRQANLDTTDQITAQVETILAAEQQVRDYTANIGRGSPYVYYNEEPEQELPSYAQIVVNLRDDLAMPVETYVNDLRQRLQAIAGANVEPKILAQGPVGGAAIQIRIGGEQLATLATIAAQIRSRIESVPGLIDLRDTLGEKTPQLVLELNREKAALLGVDSFSFSRTVFMALNGVEASRYRADGDDVPIVVRLSKSSLQEVSDLTRLYLPSISGDVVPFTEVAAIREVPAYARIDRRHGERAVTVECDVSGRLADEVLRDIRERMADLSLPDGYTIEYGGQDEERRESFTGLGEALLIALLLIYAILAVQFNSFMQPLVILLTVPFGVTGAVVGLLVTGNPFGFMAFIGIISLTGIIINDSIVLADLANYLQRVEGKGMYEALLEAGRRRFRPVVLTSITTIAGLTPLAIWGGSLWSPLASSVIFGLVGATVLILVILPVIYSVLVGQKEGQRSLRLLRDLKQRVLS
jgi:multidrug efflux pump subunit AcrB